MGGHSSTLRRSACVVRAFSADHELICRRGGYPTRRHNKMMDLVASFLTELFPNVSTESQLQPLTEEQLNTNARQTRRRLPVWMSKQRGFGVTMARIPFSTFGCFTLMNPAIKTPSSLIFTVSINVRRSLSMPDALLRSSMDASHNWCLRHPEAWHLRQRRSSVALLA